MDSKKHPDYSDAYQSIYGSLEEKKTGMSSDAMGSILKGNKYSSKQLFDMSKKSTAQGRHGEAHALYKEFQRKKTVKESKAPVRGRQLSKDPLVKATGDTIKGVATLAGGALLAKKFADKKKTNEEVEVGRHRAEFEKYKEELREHHAEKFNAWVQKLQEDGFDISRWEPQELIDTYIKENNLWKSRETIEEAVGDGYPARIEGPQKGLGTALCPTCGQFGCTKEHKEEEEVEEGKAYGLYRGDGKVKLPGAKKKKEGCKTEQRELESDKAIKAANGGKLPSPEEPLNEEELEESEKTAQKAYKRAQELGAKRRRSKDPSGIYKSERAGYNLAQSQRSRNADLDTQGGPQTGGGPKDFGFARHKKNPVKSKKTGDTGAEGHYKKRDQKVTSKSGKTTRYKLKWADRADHHSTRRQELKDPKKNPKHTANTKKEEYSDWRLDLLTEEGYDHWRDKQLMKYGTGWRGTDRSGPSSSPSRSSKKTKGKTVLQRETEKKYGKGKSALDIVKAKIEAEHGKGAIMDTKKKKK